MRKAALGISVAESVETPGRQGFDAFKASLCDAAGAPRVALVLSCVDNYEARMTINQARRRPQAALYMCHRICRGPAARSVNTMSGALVLHARALQHIYLASRTLEVDTLLC